MNKAERFPLPAVSEGLDFGARYRAGAFPTFISFDAQVTEALPFPGSFPNSKRKKVRVGPAAFYITIQYNPINRAGTTWHLQFGRFFHNLATSVRSKF